MHHASHLTIPGITITGTLGKGATSIVYRARQIGIERDVAVKVIMHREASDPDAAEHAIRAQRESYALGLANHPNVAAIYNCGHTEAFTYIVQEFIEGSTLKAAMQAGPLPVSDARAVMRGVCAGLEHLHDSGIEAIRDLKPENILLRGGKYAKPVLIDLGIARLANSTLTQVGALMFTPAYASPEQWRGEQVDRRTDIWSAGATFYHMLTGRRPFEGESGALMLKALQNEPPSASSLQPGIPRDLDAVIRAAMAKDRTFRFASALQFLARIEDATAALPETAIFSDSLLPAADEHEFTRQPPWFRAPEASPRRTLRGAIRELLDLD